MKTLLVRLNQSLSKKIFGSYIGLERFFWGHLKIFFHRKKIFRFKKSPGIKQLLETGYLTFDQLIPTKELDRCYAIIQQKLEDEKEITKLSNTQKYKDKGFKTLLNDPHKIEGIYDLIPREVTHIMEEFYGSSKYKTLPEVWRNFHVPDEIIRDNEVLSDRFHLDANDYTYLKLFVLVHDVDESQGPYTFIDKIDSKKFIRSGEYQSRYHYKSENLEEKSIKAEGPKGTFIITHNAFCLHKAGIPKKGKFRDIIQYKFYL